jgi:hypothetical protein
MIIPVEALKEWLQDDPLWASYGFVFAQGQWVDTVASATQRICFLTSSGGRVSAEPSLFYDSVRMTLLGPQKGGAQMKAIRDIAYAIRERLINDWGNCDVTRFRLQAAPTGPFFTTEERPVMELNFELIS